jgi:hypothetical protein
MTCAQARVSVSAHSVVTALVWSRLCSVIIKARIDQMDEARANEGWLKSLWLPVVVMAEVGVVAAEDLLTCNMSDGE